MAVRVQRRHSCPRCGGREVERSSRQHPLERLYLTLARRRPYRCLHCARRFYDRPL